MQKCKTLLSRDNRELEILQSTADIDVNLHEAEDSLQAEYIKQSHQLQSQLLSSFTLETCCYCWKKKALDYRKYLSMLLLTWPVREAANLSVSVEVEISNDVATAVRTTEYSVGK